MAELNRWLEQVIDACHAVGREEVMPRYMKVAHERKADGSLMTEADLAAQHALSERLRAIADYPVLGEEMTEAEQHAVWDAGLEGFWCVDPIDGTSNFINGVPYFALSVALVRRRASVLGVIHDPAANETFSAVRGQGAHLNGERLPIKPPPARVNQCMAGVELKRVTRALAARLAHEHPFSSQRNFGASTLDWCYLAAGRLHLYLHGGQKMWDYAAGVLILEEAGGSVCTITGDGFHDADPWGRSVLAALTPELQAEWKAWVLEKRAAA